MPGPGNGETPAALREQVRSGILASLERDLEQRGGRTARRLLIAGLVGVPGAIGATLLLSGHPYGHHPPWHAVVFGALWTGVLVVCLAVALLDIRTPSLPLARSARIAMIGLGLAGICGAACPDAHFLHWWVSTSPGGWLAGWGGRALSALCFGVVTALGVGVGATMIGLSISRARMLHPLVPAAMLLAVLAPGIALQSVGERWAVLSSWLLGSAAGAYLGVLLVAWVRGRVVPGRSKSWHRRP